MSTESEGSASSPDVAPEGGYSGESAADPNTSVASDGSAAEPRRRFAWWHGLKPMTRRAIRVSGALLVALGISGVFAVGTASYTGSLGPHVAEYNTRLNGEVRIDMGPLGALVIASPLPANLGVDVVVREIPDQLTTDGQDPIQGLTADLNSYSQFLANPQATIDDAARGLVRDAVGRAVVTLCVLMTVIALGRLSAHGVLREAAKTAWRRPGVPFVAPTLVAVLVILPMSDLTRSFGSEGRTSPVLASTPLAEARITGRLATIIDHYGGMVLRAVEENTRFYEEVEQNLIAAYAADPAPLAPPPRPVPPDDPSEDPTSDQPEETADGEQGSAEETGEAGSAEETGGEAGSADEGVAEAGGSDGDAAVDADAAAPDGGAPNDPDEPGEQDTPDPGPEPEPDPVDLPAFTDPDAEYATFLVVSDLHCNVGMAPVIGRAADLAEVDAILNLGDTVMSGTSVESFCVNAFADGIDSRFPVIVADGNHDSTLTGEQERARGWVVLDGSVQNVAGVRILGDSDPTLTEIGTGTRLERDETVAQMGERLRDQACELAQSGEPVDILMVHSPHAGRFAIESGCATLNLSGHMHTRAGPWQHGLGLQYISGSTAGAALGRPTVGPLQSQADMAVMHWNLTSGLPEHYRVILAQTNRTVRVGPWQNFPAMPSVYVDRDAPPVVEEEIPEDVEEGDPSVPDQNLPEDEEAARTDEEAARTDDEDADEGEG